MTEKIAVLLPAYNEEVTIQKVIADFQKALPNADIYVYDNNSKDKTNELAREAGAIVRFESDPKFIRYTVVESLKKEILVRLNNSSCNSNVSSAAVSLI